MAAVPAAYTDRGRVGKADTVPSAFEVAVEDTHIDCSRAVVGN